MNVTDADDNVVFFGQHMTRDWADWLERTQRLGAYAVGGLLYARIPYGSETFRSPTEAASAPCRHCSTIFGKLHSPRCDYEQCPRCNFQSMTCDCEYESEQPPP